MTITPPQDTWLPERPEGAGPTTPAGERAWQVWIAPVALLSGFAAAFIGGLLITIVYVVVSGSDIEKDQPPGVLLGATFVQDLGLVAAAILFARLSGPVAARHFGLRRSRGFWLAVGWAFAAYAAFVVFSGLWGLLVDVDNTEETLDSLGVDESTAALIAGMLLICVGAPLVEEFFFRGFFYAALRNWRGAPLAAIITGVLFGAIHIGSSPVAALLPLAILGILFCAVYELTGSLYPCIVLHAINNSLAFGISQDWTWQIPVLLAGSLLTCALILWPFVRLGRRSDDVALATA